VSRVVRGGRAPLAARAWRDALDAACAAGPPDVGTLLHPWWRPLGAALDGCGAIGRDYPCMVARLADRPAGDRLRARYFGDIEDRYRGRCAAGSAPGGRATSRPAGAPRRG